MNREELKKHMIGFHNWMLKHDRADYAEEFFHYTDEDMAEEYIKEVSPQDADPVYKAFIEDDIIREEYKEPINKPKEDKDYTYKWIREKSGK